MIKKIAIHWFRQDLRLSDNPALTEATKHGLVLPIYILDEGETQGRVIGCASRWWLYNSLRSLNESLEGKLSLYSGDPLEIMQSLIRRHPIQAVYWNHCYESWQLERDKNLQDQLENSGVSVKIYNGSLLWEPWEIKKEDDTPYKVFTPFYKKGCLNAREPREPLPELKNVQWYCDDSEESLSLNELKLLSDKSWYHKLESYWDIGEEGAQQRLESFLAEGLEHYKKGRDLPAKNYVSRLSPHLHFGEISPNQLWYKVRSLGENEHIDHFCSELGWREFSYSQLYYNPDLSKKNLQAKFDLFPWDKNNNSALLAWQKGKTGIPMVDAGMRELCQTGYMHNRVRMIAASFLVKNLLIHWHHGERWFWDCLVDADLANNAASWQWVAGCGADAAPYFRIFNPVSQGRKFDPDGEYVRRFVPEIAALPDKYLFSPWEAPEDALRDAGIRLGDTYPGPIVDLKESRQKALEAFNSLKRKSTL